MILPVPVPWRQLMAILLVNSGCDPEFSQEISSHLRESYHHEFVEFCRVGEHRADEACGRFWLEKVEDYLYDQTTAMLAALEISMRGLRVGDLVHFKPSRYSDDDLEYCYGGRADNLCDVVGHVRSIQPSSLIPGEDWVRVELWPNNLSGFYARHLEVV